MTWGKALPVLALAVLFDAIRFMFEQFWFFGPTLISLGTSAYFGGGVLGTAAGAVAGGAAAFWGDPELVFFGVVMAMAVGFLGWLTIFFMLFMTNARIFKTSGGTMLWLLCGLGVSEVPFIGTLPALTSATVKIYRDQIQKEKNQFALWKEQQAQQERIQQQSRFAE
jgi:hypothetical protein